MKLNELIKNLKEVEKKYGNLDVIYAIDDEGNGYQDIYSSPTICERLSDDSYIEDENLKFNTKKPNTVIIN